MSGVSQETQRTIEASTMFPGFRFCPTDVELISYYLRKKMEGADQCVDVIPEVEICKHEPWDLPGRSVVQSDNEWFFFSSRGRKYPNGLQSKRATELGYWKATGKERNVKAGAEVIGTKRTLVFHLGRAPKGERTEWIMHEYSMVGRAQDSLVVCRLRKNVDFRPCDSSARASLPHPHTSGAPNDSLAASGGENDWVGGFEGERVGEGSKKYSSSHDSYSIDQFDSASESEQRLPSTEINPAESSSYRQECPDDDFYADILKDEIIKLDEAPFSAPPLLPPIGSIYEPIPLHQQSTEFLVSQAQSLLTSPPQGAAKRGIKLSRRAPDLPPPAPMQFAGATREFHLEKPHQQTQRSSSEFTCYISTMFYKLSTSQLISVGLVILTLLVLYLSKCEGWQQLKEIVFSSLNKVSLH